VKRCEKGWGKEFREGQGGSKNSLEAFAGGYGRNEENYKARLRGNQLEGKGGWGCGHKPRKRDRPKDGCFEKRTLGGKKEEQTNKTGREASLS